MTRPMPATPPTETIALPAYDSAQLRRESAEQTLTPPRPTSPWWLLEGAVPASLPEKPVLWPVWLAGEAGNEVRR